MSTGKKGKKPKAQKVSLQEFLATTPSSGGTTQVVVQKVSSWAEECEDDDDHRPSRPEFIELPTAPRAARIFDDDSIPYTGPFSARVSNLPFDTNEQDVDEFFVDRDIRIKEMRLARDEQNDRLRGYGHIEFETRDDLVAAIMLPDAMIRNRRIRIELAGENDQRDGRAMRKRYDNYTPRDPTSGDSTNWRDRKESAFEPVERENRRGGGGGYQRSNFQNRHDNNNNDDDGGSNWRMGDRPNDSPPPERRRNNYGDRDRGERRGGNRYERRDAPEEERPVLNLQPRTKPLPVLTFPKEEELERPVRKTSAVNGDAENHNDSGLPDDEDKEEKAPPPPKPKPVPSVNIFGQAKPVDTAAREREIEEKLKQERDTKIQREKEEREKQRLEVENGHEAEVKKDVIVIKTEKARQQEEAVNWRKHDEPSNEPIENRPRDNGRRFDGERRDRRDDRPRQFGNKDNRDNRERNFNRGDRDYRGGNMGPRGDRPRDNRRDGPRREFNNEIRRDEPMKEPKREKVVKDFEERMPKYQAPAGPNLSVSNAFAGLDDEVDAD